MRNRSPDVDPVDLALDEMEKEVDSTLDWRQAETRPAMDVSDFSGASISSLKRIQWWIRELRRANDET
jgi:hypothetical protein